MPLRHARSLPFLTLLLSLGLALSPRPAAAQQQWDGSSDPSGVVYRSGNVGIGTSSPQAELAVSGAVHAQSLKSIRQPSEEYLNLGTDAVFSSDRRLYFRLNNDGSRTGNVFYAFSANDAEIMRLDESGNVGIGTQDPRAELDVKGGVYADKIRSTYDPDQEYINFDTDAVFSGDRRLSFRLNNDGSRTGNVFYAFSANDAEIMRLDESGNVGIGTQDPRSRLAVSGTVTAQEVVVTETGWPDFVFADGYDLPSLREVEAHIEREGRLPGVPSAEAVAAEGVRLGEMNATLLQKVEELTLYAIEQRKRVKAQRERAETMQAEKEALRRELDGLREQVETLKQALEAQGVRVE
jgi:hypothetical protein